MATYGEHHYHLAAADREGLLNGYAGIPWKWGLNTIATQATYNMFDTGGVTFAGGGMRGPRQELVVINAVGIVTNGAGVGTIVINHVTAAGVVAAITNTVDLGFLGLADTDIFDFAQIDDATARLRYGENLQIVTTQAARALVIVEMVWTELGGL